MKVVILHDWLTGFRGGERVLEAICEMYPDAPIYTLIHKKGSTSPIIESREIHTSFLDKVPGIYNHYRFYLPLMPLAAKTLKIKHEADLVISSSHCVIKGVKKPIGSYHICYIHSPMRYIYDQFNNYFGKSSRLILIMAKIFRPYLKWYDKNSNKNIDLFLANSYFVKDRIERYYQEKSKVIYPFVDLDDFREIQRSPPAKENFYLMVTAFAPNKKVDLAIDAFNQLGLELKIIGSGSQENTEILKKMAESNIEFLGNASRNLVISSMAKAKGFVFPGVEDFGITPLEVLASGTPIIAYKVGGALETLTEEVAYFFSEPTKESLIEAVLKCENSLITREKLIERSEHFSKNRFKQEIISEISQIN